MLKDPIVLSYVGYRSLNRCIGGQPCVLEEIDESADLGVGVRCATRIELHGSARRLLLGRGTSCHSKSFAGYGGSVAVGGTISSSIFRAR